MVLFVRGLYLCNLGSGRGRGRQASFFFVKATDTEELGVALISLELLFWLSFLPCACVHIIFGNYVRQIFVHLKDNAVLRWVALRDLISVDFRENEAPSCALQAG